MSDATRKHMLVNVAGLAIFPLSEDDIGDDKSLAAAKVVWEKFSFALGAFDTKVSEVQNDARLTAVGRKEEMQRVGKSALDDLARVEPMVNSVKQAAESAQPSKALLKAPSPSDAAAAVRAAEFRTFLRESGGAENALIDAASNGETELVSFILAAPRGMFKVSPQNVRLAEKLLGEKLDPAGTKRLGLLTDAWEAVERIRRGVRAHIAHISGVRDPLVPLTARTPQGVVTLEA